MLAEDGEDEELDSDEMGESDSEDEAIMAKLADIKKKQNGNKKAPAPESDSDEASEAEESDDSEEADLQALLSKKK